MTARANTFIIFRLSLPTGFGQCYAAADTMSAVGTGGGGYTLVATRAEKISPGYQKLTAGSETACPRLGGVDF